MKSFKKILFVRGLPKETKDCETKKVVTIKVNHLPAAELNIAFQQSEIIISRSGYTTIMDLVKLGKNAILVPTPGQTEQEYLSSYLMKKKFFYSVEQQKFSLQKVIENFSNFQTKSPESCMNDYKKVISEFVQSLKSGNFAPQYIILNQKIKAHLGLIGTNLFFAANYSNVKYFTSHRYAGPFGLNIIRIGVSLILFWLVYIFKPDKTKFQKKEFVPLLLCAVTAIALNQMFFIKGLSFTLSIHASLLTLLTPILITIFAARILKEKLTVEKVVGLVAGASGAILLISSREPSAPGDNIFLGDFLVLLSALSYTFYFILVKPFTNKYPAIFVMRWVFTFGFFLILPLCTTEFSEISWNSFTPTDWLLLFLITVPGTFLAYIFNAYGIKKLNASIAGAYIYSQPVFAVAIALIFLKEHLSFYKIIAAMLIFTGVFLSNRKIENPAKFQTGEIIDFLESQKKKTLLVQF